MEESRIVRLGRSLQQGMTTCVVLCQFQGFMTHDFFCKQNKHFSASGHSEYGLEPMHL